MLTAKIFAIYNLRRVRVLRVVHLLIILWLTIRQAQPDLLKPQCLRTSKCCPFRDVVKAEYWPGRNLINGGRFIDSRMDLSSTSL